MHEINNMKKLVQLICTQRPYEVRNVMQGDDVLGTDL